MRRVRISKQVILAAVCLAIPTQARSSGNIFERATTCAAANYSPCAGIESSLPDGFCCPATASCLPLAGNTTLLCCPTGNDCSTIQPIPCDISLQNATAHPDNILKTTALSIPLTTCGTKCCPFGYSCDGTNCFKNQNQDSVPSAATSTSSTIIPKPTASSCNNATVDCHCDKFPVGAVLAGFFPGLVLGVLLTIASVCLLGARRRKSDNRRRSGSSFGNISEPQPIGDTRTDFLRKQPQTPSSTADSKRLTGVQRVRSLFRKPTTPSSTSSARMPATPRPAPPIPMMSQRSQERPVTPVLQREPSYEDINIFADGDTASALRERENGGRRLAPGQVDGRDSHQTTFTSMMEQSGLAGLQKGQPYVYKGNSPGYSPPPRARET